MPTSGEYVSNNSSRSRRWQLDRYSEYGVFLAVALVFTVSGGMLWLVGYNYDGIQGGGATKIHPSTYLIVALFGWRMVSVGNPISYLSHATAKQPASLGLIAVSIVLFVSIIIRQAPGMAGIIDTYVAPALLVIVLTDASRATMDRMTRLIHILMGANALIGLMEFVLKVRFFAYRFDGMSFDEDTRSNALQGHPLINASITAFYIAAIMGSGRPEKPATRFSLLGLQLAGLVVFGGRSALVLTLAICGAYGGYLALKSLSQGRINLLYAAAGTFAITLVPIAVGGLAIAGFFSDIAERFVSDGGSANARVLMTELLRHFSWSELLIGPDIGTVTYLRRIYGLTLGIENPLINFALYDGALLTIALAIALFFFLREISRRANGVMWPPMLMFVLLINTFESISSKTTLITKFVVVVICLYRTTGLAYSGAKPSASTMPGSRSLVSSSMMPIPSNRFQIAQGKPSVSAVRRTSRT